MVKKFKAFVNEESVKDFEEDVLGETQSKKQIDLQDKKKEKVEKKVEENK
tara:strand:- start:328 stop:477 length:150 start_codon:yes stop_codon:yes gene_type:complete